MTYEYRAEGEALQHIQEWRAARKRSNEAARDIVERYFPDEGWMRLQNYDICVHANGRKPPRGWQQVGELLQLRKNTKAAKEYREIPRPNSLDLAFRLFPDDTMRGMENNSVPLPGIREEEDGWRITYISDHPPKTPEGAVLLSEGD